MFKNIRYIFLVFLITACKQGQQGPDVSKIRTAPLETALSSDLPKIRKVMDHPDQHGVQVVFSRVNYNESGEPVLEDFYYHANDSVYFYPASTVKFPVAILAMERLKEKKWMDRNTRFYFEEDTVVTTVGEEVKKIFAVSDNVAFNRLFEFLGTDYINNKMEEKELVPFRLSHRLSTTDAANITTRPIVAYKNDSTLVQLFSSYNKEPQPLQIKQVLKGKGYMKDSVLVEGPMDFSLKNYYPVKTQHNTMKRLIFPELYPKKQQFNLRDEDRKFLLYAMKATPAEAGYDQEEYPDSFDRFFMYGDTTTTIPKHIEIYNKVGYAYGTLTDCAYIKDKENKVEFILTATVLVNENAIFNDGNYDYKETGHPFLAELGRQVYQNELALKK
ncbi:serine hydrolase [Sinomicrobium weinanense]|uniref:Serine hydrolase n=1 Tax=Sinomicrobium weinanense TaxID=2842200 RepID=A0A926Q3U6_9FLAO|nr:serine hydrolase [Sinomicrobium weinanense]MBC9797933.1 serine hydrolase [Sinomicrobium weinanense]MBU3123178.1 class A beta-lactamase-related serine hydrolase [Sinomicrobium weinanense]